MATNRRADHLREEAAFLPRSVEDLAELRRRILDAGHPDQIASGIVGWLVAKAADDPDRTGPNTRSRYRKVLAELEPLHSPEPDGDRRPLEVVGGSSSHGRRPRGRVRKALVALVVAGSGLAAGGGHQQATEASTEAHSRQSAAETPGLQNRRQRRSRRGRKLAA
jgi:hypothetical protein